MERTNLIGGRLLSSVVPVLLGLLGAFIASLPVSFLGGLVPSPLLALMPIYFWGLVRPDLMSPAWTFVIGLVQDVLAGGPPGLWTASFVVGYVLIDRQRDALAGLSGFGAIFGFATVALAACTTAYLITAVYFWQLLSPASVMSELAMTVLFYLPGVIVLGGIHRHFVGPLRSDF